MNIQGIFQNSSSPLLEQVAGYAQMRHNVLAGNIANISTPGYQFRDLPPEAFQEFLKMAAQAQSKSSDKGVAPAGGLANAMPGADGLDPFEGLKNKINGSLTMNVANRSLEYQVAEITKNQMQHTMAMAILNDQYQLMENAISERV